jgi:UV DNA damage endonuclease
METPACRRATYGSVLDLEYDILDLPRHQSIIDAYRQCGEFAQRYDIRTSFHPDQFVVIASPRPGVRQKSLAELVYQALVFR